jgi:hypothetical protein
MSNRLKACAAAAVDLGKHDNDDGAAVDLDSHAEDYLRRFDAQPLIKWPNAPKSEHLGKTRGATKPAQLQAACEELNESYALIMFGDDVRVIQYANKRGEPHRELKLGAFHTLLAPLQYVVKTAKRGVSRKALTQYWLSSPWRVHYTGVCFDPSGDHYDPETLNLWNGWSVKPKKGDWSRLRKHIYEVLCHNNIDLFIWLLCWMADLVQRPHKKPGTCVVVRGEQGTGKSIVAAYLARLAANNSLTVSRNNQLVGRFTDHLASKLFVCAEEAMWGGDRQAESVLKDLITADTMAVEAKHKAVITVANHLRLWYCSNSDWVIPAAWDARRYFVLQTRDTHRNEPTWFEPIIAQMEREGGLEAMMYDLAMLWTPKGINLRSPPRTPWLNDQIGESMDSMEKWWRHCLSEGKVGYGAVWPNTADKPQTEDEKTEAAFHAVGSGQEQGQHPSGLQVLCDTAHKDYSDFCAAQRINHPKTAVALGKFLKGCGVDRHRLKKGSNRDKYVYDFQSLEAHREAFFEKYGTLFDAELGDIGGGDYDFDVTEGMSLDSIQAWRAWAEGERDRLPE